VQVTDIDPSSHDSRNTDGGKAAPSLLSDWYDVLMRSRILIFALVVGLGSFALPYAAHAAIPFFGPIIPNSSTCAAGWAMLITVINNLISFLITIAIVFVAPLMIAYAGFLFVVNPVNSGGISQAKTILQNTIIGIVIALAGYLIVDALMAVFYNGSLGSWSQIINWSGDECLPQAGTAPGVGMGPGVGVGGITLNAPPAGKTGTACDPSVVMAGAAAGGYVLTAGQANILACIAQPESSCGANLQNYNWGNGSSAYGAFQVLLSTNSSCYENAACYSAAGVAGPLNCSSGFTGGNPIPGSAIVTKCRQAAANINCSASAAACLLQKSGGSFSPWQADLRSAQQTGCITGA